MRIPAHRRSYARSPSNAFAVLQRPTDILDHAASILAFALLLAAWVVFYVTILPADPVPSHRTHLAQVPRP